MSKCKWVVIILYSLNCIYKIQFITHNNLHGCLTVYAMLYFTFMAIKVTSLVYPIEFAAYFIAPSCLRSGVVFPLQRAVLWHSTTA